MATLDSCGTLSAPATHSNLVPEDWQWKAAHSKHTYKQLWSSLHLPRTPRVEFGPDLALPSWETLTNHFDFCFAVFRMG